MNKQRTLWIATLFLVVMGLVQFSWAEQSQEEQEAERVRAAEVMNRAAKTPDEFMQRVKGVWNKPGMRIQEVAEAITGVGFDRLNRKYPPRLGEQQMRFELDMIYEKYPKSPYDGHVSVNYKDLEKNTFNNAFVLKFRGKRVRGEAERILCITPALTKEMFGEPDQIDLAGIKIDDGGSIKYLYTDGSRSMAFKYDGIKGNTLFRHRFEEHKNVCMVAFIFIQDH